MILLKSHNNKASDLKDILIRVGFKDININKNEKKGWVAILAKK